MNLDEVRDLHKEEHRRTRIPADPSKCTRCWLINEVEQLTKELRDERAK